MVKILHFADAHIDMANYGRHDPASGMPMRVMDFLKSLDTIVDTAIAEGVDLVVFAGDAYKDRNPAPTFQREWDKRMMRLSRAGIPTVVIVGNHDMSPSMGRAHALEELKTLEVPHIQVIDEPSFLGPEEVNGVGVQIVAIPWITRSGMMAHLEMKVSDPAEVYAELEERLTVIVKEWLAEADPKLPTILTAHATVQGASYGGERSVMLGGDLVLPGGLVKQAGLDYVALGHIHKAQDLNEGGHPPVVYPGSIERVDFGEAGDKKYFVIAEVEKGNTKVEWRELEGVRPFLDRRVNLSTDREVTKRLIEALPAAEEMAGAIVRLVVEYPREWESLIDEAALRELAAEAFEFHLVKRPVMEARIRIPEDQSVGSMTPVELLEIYLKSTHTEEEERQALLKLAEEIIVGTNDDGR